jgi:ADP-L-glycero-D-manno-heptose 6-epimerase
MIVVTGAAGFIGSYLVGYLNRNNITNIIIVDDFSIEKKHVNFNEKTYLQKVDRSEFIDWLENNHPEMIIHLGARTDTTEFDYTILNSLNLEYTQKIWSICSRKSIPLIYASSAATYGSGELGYSDLDNNLPFELSPLNPYGISKNEFDKYAILSKDTPPYWYGLKFFNVYGPNEYHKSRMASVIFHTFNQIKTSGKSKLFRSHKTEFKDGMQLRDFIYVKDVAKVIFWLMSNKPTSGIYNLGTGKARAFLDLANAVYSALNLPVNIEFIDIPEDIRDKYQYFTEANMNKLIDAGYKDPFTSLEDGIGEYVKDYLLESKIY